jgi:hypothetical protein
MRRNLDFYPTGKKLVDILLSNIKLENIIFEPCAGQGHISKYLNNPITNDIKGGWDATNHIYWDNMNPKPDWTVTNPPFSLAVKILNNAFRYSNVGVAFLLRLSFLEPTKERERFLVSHPPNKLIVLPRYSFTGDGKTDSVTCAWMIWDKTGENWIRIAPR